jgi:hypothetical protein
MTAIGRYVAVALVFFLAGMLSMYYAASRGGNNPMPTGDALVSRHTVTPTAPLQALDKTALRKQGKIDKPVERDPVKEVLATGTITDDSGTLYVGAELDTETGETRLIEKRPVMETMCRFEIGLGYGLESGDLAKALQGRATIGRMDRVYFTGQAEYFDVDRKENRHPWNAMAFVNLRF